MATSEINLTTQEENEVLKQAFNDLKEYSMVTLPGDGIRSWACEKVVSVKIPQSRALFNTALFGYSKSGIVLFEGARKDVERNNMRPVFAICANQTAHPTYKHFEYLLSLEESDRMILLAEAQAFLIALYAKKRAEALEAKKKSLVA